jgi:hypothetical protein
MHNKPHTQSDGVHCGTTHTHAHVHTLLLLLLALI